MYLLINTDANNKITFAKFFETPYEASKVQIEVGGIIFRSV